MQICRSKPKIGSRPSIGSAALELAPCLFLIIFGIVIPVIDLLSFISAVATLNTISYMSAHSASRATTYGEAAEAAAFMGAQAMAINRLALLKPKGGIQGNGISLLVERHAIKRAGTSAFDVKTIDPAQETLSTIDSKNYVYFYRATAEFEVLPLFNLSGAPLGLSEVQGLGRPVLLQYTSSASIEHPEGLNERGELTKEGNN